MYFGVGVAVEEQVVVAPLDLSNNNNKWRQSLNATQQYKAPRLGSIAVLGK
jgi:hypothetical protein